MVRSRLYQIAWLLLAAPHAAVAALERGIAFLWALFAPEFDGGTTFRDEAWGGDFTRHEPLDPALVNSMRHEAGMRPLPG